jgi:hypothetical protein
MVLSSSLLPGFWLACYATCRVIHCFTSANFQQSKFPTLCIITISRADMNNNTNRGLCYHEPSVVSSQLGNNVNTVITDGVNGPRGVLETIRRSRLLQEI